MKQIILALSFVLLLSNVCADPIFLLSSKKISDASQNLFLDAQAFTDVLDNKILKTNNLPNNIFLFNVKVTDQKYINDPNLILKELSSRSSLQQYFASSANTFSSAYIEGGFSENFDNQLMNVIEQKGYTVLPTTLKAFDFDVIRQSRRNGNSNIVNRIEFPISELNLLDSLFHNYYSYFDSTSRNNFLIVLKFIDATTPSTYANVVRSGRMLQVDTVTGENPADTQTPDNAQTGSAATATTGALGITAGGFSGFIISIFALIALYFGFQLMKDIKSPSRFFKDQLQIGKEH